MEKVVVNGVTGKVERVTLSTQEAADYLALQQTLQTAETARRTTLTQRQNALKALLPTHPELQALLDYFGIVLP